MSETHQQSSESQARISLNQVGEYPFKTPSQKIEALKDQKFKSPKRTYYSTALNGILSSFDDLNGEFNSRIVGERMKELGTQPAGTRNKAARLENNREMLRRFSGLCFSLKCPSGTHQIIRRNATLAIDGVNISARPEILTQSHSGKLVLTKFRFSKSKVSADASEIVLLLMLKFGESLKKEHGSLDLDHTRLVDCYAGLIIPGHSLSAIRERQLEAAQAEIRQIWPRITPSSKASDFF